MRITKLDWDDYRIEHIAAHGVELDEVWEVCEDSLHLAHRQGQNHYRLYGQTAGGPLLVCGFGACRRFNLQADYCSRYE